MENTEVVEVEKIQPIVVELCPECTFPKEYCEFSHDLKKFKKEFNDSKQDETKDKEERNDENGKESQKSVEKKEKTEEVVEEKKEEKDSKKKEESNKILVYKQKVNPKRGKTLVFNLDKFKLNLKDVSKLFSKKFACSSTVTVEKGKECVNLTGLYDEDLIEFLISKYPELKRSNFKVQEGK